MMASKGDLVRSDLQRLSWQSWRLAARSFSVVNVCGQCHAVNSELFNKSAHSKIFVQMGIPGCAACHSNHAIVATSDAMLGSGDKSACASLSSADSSGGMLPPSMLGSIDRLKAST